MDRTRRTSLGVALATASLLAAACSSTGPATSAGATQAPPPRPQPVAGLTKPTKVLTVVEENHTSTAVLKGMPYLARVAKAYGHTTRYRAVTHPSLPNYLALVGGTTFGVHDDRNPSSNHAHGRSVFDQALAANKTATLYAESMHTRCRLTPRGHYAVKHNPWAYFSDKESRANCRRHDVPAGTTKAGALRRDIINGTLPNVGMVIPNLVHDAHDGTLAAADHWLASWMKVVQQGPDWKAGRLAVVVTFDEDDEHGNNTVLTTVLAPGPHHVVARAAYTHYSWTRYVDQLLGVPYLRKARSARSLGPAFGI